MVQYVLATILESQAARRKGEGELCPPSSFSESQPAGRLESGHLVPSFPIKTGILYLGRRNE